MPEPTEKESTIDLQFRAIVVKVEHTGTAGHFRAVVLDTNQAVVLDLSSMIDAAQLRNVQIQDYADIVISLRKKEVVDAQVASAQLSVAA